jgi:hypothetical protein
VIFGKLVALFLTLVDVPTVNAVLARGTKSPQYVSRLVDRLMSSVPGGTAAPSAVHDAQRHD